MTEFSVLKGQGKSFLWIIRFKSLCKLILRLLGSVRFKSLRKPILGLVGCAWLLWPARCRRDHLGGRVDGLDVRDGRLDDAKMLLIVRLGVVRPKVTSFGCEAARLPEWVLDLVVAQVHWRKEVVGSVL